MLTTTSLPSTFLAVRVRVLALRSRLRKSGLRQLLGFAGLRRAAPNGRTCGFCCRSATEAGFQQHADGTAATPASELPSRNRGGRSSRHRYWCPRMSSLRTMQMGPSAGGSQNFAQALTRRAHGRGRGRRRWRRGRSRAGCAAAAGAGWAASSAKCGGGSRQQGPRGGDQEGRSRRMVLFLCSEGRAVVEIPHVPVRRVNRAGGQGAGRHRLRNPAKVWGAAATEGQRASE